MADEVSGERAALTGAHALHLARVLRARVGQEFDISTGNEVRRGRVVNVRDERVEFELGDTVETADESNITMLIAVFKFDRFEWAVEKCTELGTKRIVPVIARRTDTHLAHASAKRVERWERIAREAAQQSRRLNPPGIAAPMKLKDALERETGLRIVLSENEDALTLRRVLELEESGAEVTIAVGPEGGWTDDELDLFKRQGWQAVSLGDTILRAETAAIAAVAIAMAMKRA